MRRASIFLVLLTTMAAADDTATPVPAPQPETAAEESPAPKRKKAKSAAKPAPKRYTLHYGMREGARYIGSNTVAFSLKTTLRTGTKTTTESRESVERTERFRDHVVQYSGRGLMELEREYQRIFTKVRTSERERPDVEQSPLQGSTVTISEKRRRRSIRSKAGLNVPPFVRKTVGMEIDWRDVLPREPVTVGAVWEADAEALARRIAPYLDGGTRSKMMIRFEGVDVENGKRVARLYIDWEVQGMRDKQLYTKAVLAGDARFDLDLQRFVLIDIAGSFTVNGAIIANDKVEIIQSEGKVQLKSTLREERPESVSAAAPQESESDEK